MCFRYVGPNLVDSGGPLRHDSDINFDTRSSDYGKIKVGLTRLDPLAGHAQVLTLLGRLYHGETKRLKSGRIVKIRGEDLPYGGGDAADVIFRFFRTKLSPPAATFVDVLAGTDVNKQPVTPESEAPVPLAVKDIYEAMEAHGAVKGGALGILAIFGMGLNTHTKRKRRRSR